MTTLSMLHRKAKEPVTVEELTLSAELSFLNVIVAACQDRGRRTVMAHSDGVTYTVMIDRGGPFNATGGGLSGRAVLERAAVLRDGNYTVAEGWPVEQPLYQLGLDSALESLAQGTPTEAQRLPATRGVDAIRNAAWSALPIADIAAPAEPADPLVRNGDAWLGAAAPAPIETPTPDAPALPPHPSPAATNAATGADFPQSPWLPGHAALAPAPASEPVELAQPGFGAEPRYAPGPTTDVATARPATVVPAVVAGPAGSDGGTRWVPTAPADTAMDVTAGASAVPGAGPPQGPIKRALTRFLLWTVQVEDDTDVYTLGQALTLVGRALRTAFGFVIDPIQREVFKRWHRVREDWRRSGEEVAKKKPRRRPSTRPK